MSKPDISVVVQGLTDRIVDLVSTLLPAAVKHGHEMRCGSLAGEKGQSLSIHIGPSRRGVWQDFSSADDKGDALDLVAKCKFNGNKSEAYKWSVSWLGLDDLSPDRLKQHKRQVDQRKKDREERDRKEEAYTRKYAYKIWLDSSADILNSPVYDYLKGRGVDLKKLEYIPRSIRFAPALKEPSTGKDFPAMVTAINGVNGNFAAIHRTFLHVHADGHVVKADVLDAKMTLGRLKGGCIRLWRGEKVNPDTGEIKRGQPWGKIDYDCRLTICEGIEDGLTIALARTHLKIAICVDVGKLLSLLLPPCFTEIHIVRDNDEPGSNADKTLQAAIGNFHRQGRKVFISRAPEGFKDVNDLLTRGHVHGG